MSIKRITDLEQLSVTDDNLDKFKQSFIEISYNEPPGSDQDAHQYVSRGMKVADFISALGMGADEEVEDVLSGDFIYNDGTEGSSNNYKCELNFGDATVQAEQFIVQKNGDDQIAVFDENGLNMRNKKVTAVTEPTFDTDVVTLEYLNKRLKALENQGDVITPNMILSGLYPVGSVYISTKDECPLSTLIDDSEWIKVPGDFYLKSAGDADAGVKDAGRMTLKTDDFTFTGTRGTAIIKDKGHLEGYFLKSLDMQMAANVELKPASYTVYMWKRES